MERCAYCHSPDTTTPMIHCSYCGTAQHGECRAQHGGCVVCGKNEPVEVTARRKIRVDLPGAPKDHSNTIILIGLLMTVFGSLVVWSLS